MPDIEVLAAELYACWQGDHRNSRSWAECCEKLPGQAEWFRKLADKAIEVFKR